MTTYQKRRGRRSLAAVLAAMLVASVLAVVAGSPAQAANTAKQALLDTDSDGVGDTREFGGKDRYDTSARLAENFVKYQGGVGTAPTVFLASGESLVDAVAVSGYAGEIGAPVLLTTTGELHPRAADFIEDYGVKMVWVLGGDVAVADSVLDEIEALQGSPKADRIQGLDRYETAAAIAAKQSAAAYWCTSTDSSAVLVNGENEMLAEAMIIAPIANRLRMPVLLTMTDELPDATAEYLRDNNIEHVQIIGGDSSVSSAVQTAVEALGVDTVARTGGLDSAATSVEVAKLLTDGCKDALTPVSAKYVALAHQNALPDGVSAGPVLATSYDSASLVPLLVVGDSLPASVSEWLAETPKTRGSNKTKTELEILAIGGTAAVSASVMDDAVAAAAAADDLTVTISADGKKGTPLRANGGEIVLLFSDIIQGATTNPTVTDAARAMTIARSVRINGRPAQLDTGTPPTFIDFDGNDSTSPTDCNRMAVKLTLGTTAKLKAGDIVSVPSGAMPGIGDDKRKVVGSSVEVAKGSAPAVKVVVFSDADDAYLVVSDADGDGPTISDEDLATDKVEYVLGAADPSDHATGDSYSGRKLTLADARGDFSAGDKVILDVGAFTDGAGNKSGKAVGTADAAPSKPSVTAVDLSKETNTTQGSVLVTAALAATTDNSADHIKIMAKAAGAAGGVHAEGWSIVFTALAKRKAADDADIAATVEPKNKKVYVTINKGVPTMAELVAALNGDSHFADLFDASVELGTNNTTGACASAGATKVSLGGATFDYGQQTANLAGGVTKVRARVTFSGYVRANGGDWSNLADDVYGSDVSTASEATLTVETSTTLPATQVSFVFAVENGAAEDDVKKLPTPGPDKVAVAADVAVDFTSDAGVANTATPAGTKLRISRSSGVLPPTS